MKFAARVASLSTLFLGRASAFSAVTKDKDPSQDLFLRKYSFLSKYSGDPDAPVGASIGHYGDTACPCIGFDGIKGEFAAELESHGQQVSVQYPNEVGARCESWDLGRHPECLSESSPEWCGKRWCFVDPCNCHIDTIPDPLVELLPYARYRGHPVAYSYATCGGDLHEKHPRYGSPGCQCVGFENAPGSIKVQLSDANTVSELDYPASLGGTCKSWDFGHHPDCKGDNVPVWCKAQWCYVDACACELESGHVPKISSYLPKATFTGKGFYYSYETCGAEDTWTKKHHPTACVNQATETLCAANDRCAWAGTRCLGKELVVHPLCEDLMRRAESGAPHHKPKSLAVITIAACMAAVATGRFA